MESNNRERILAIIVFICIGLWVSDKLILTPLYGLWCDRADEIIELEKQVDKGEQLITREDAMKARWQSMVDSDLPAETGEAEMQVMESFARWIRASGLQVTDYRPRWKTEEDEYVKYECRTAAIGTIETVSRFLYELEKDPLALKIEEIDITSRDDNGSSLSLGVVFSGIRFIEKKS